MVFILYEQTHDDTPPLWRVKHDVILKCHLDEPYLVA